MNMSFPEGSKTIYIYFSLLSIIILIGCSPEPIDVAPSTTAASSQNLIFQGTFEEANSLNDLYLEKANENSITRSSEQVRGGSNAVKFILNKTDADVADSKRSEAVLEVQEMPKFERWYGMSIFLPSSYVAEPVEEAVFQWHAINLVDLDSVLMNNAAIAMYTKNGKWELGMKYGGTFDMGVYDTNVWTDWVIHVKFSAGPDGVFEIWKNGKLMLQRNGLNNYNDLKGNFFKIGIYKYGWAQGYPSTTTSRTLYYDEIKIGNENSSYAEVAPTPTSPVLFAVNAGGSTFIASTGITYQADKNFSGGTRYQTTAAIANTVDDALYQSERLGNFTYAIPVTNGTYEITFKFAEVFHTTANKRRFDILVEGLEVISNLDIFSVAGFLTKYDAVATVMVSDGVLNIQSRTDIDNAKLSAFHIIKK